MSSAHFDKVEKLFIGISYAAAAVVGLIAAMVFVGWEFDLPLLKSGLPGLVSMNPGGTAMAFLLSSVACVCLIEPAKPAITRICGAVVVLIGALVITRYISGWDSGVDQYLFKVKLDKEALLLGHPNRMAPNTAASFVLAGTALLLLSAKPRWATIAHLVVLAGVVIASLTAIGYFYSSLTLAKIQQYIPMALNTAIAFLLLYAAILFSRPDRGLMVIASSSEAGGRMVRRLLPPLILSLIVIGGVGERLVKAHVLNENLDVPLCVIASIIIQTSAIWWYANVVNESDRKRMRAEEESAKQKLEAENANRAKSDFLANMSHELRTPLNSIIGLTRMVYEDKSIDEEHREMVGVAFRSSTNLLEIVNDILDLSKVEAGKLILEDITFSLHEVVNNVVETMLPLTSEKGLIFSHNIRPDDLPYFQGDPIRIGRVLMNLVSNGVKYTEKGSVTLDVNCTAAGDGRMIVECRVTDTGIGIAKDKHGLIFDKFAQADSSITRRFGGTGLGLAITKQIVERMNGQIGFDSEEGKGSCFWFRIPLATADIRPVIYKGAFNREQVARLPENQRKNAKDVNLLIAEDYLLNQAFLRKLLPRMGFEKLTIVDNGSAAVKAIGAAAYDMILMDCHMPVLSGYDATTQIRAREGSVHIPIIAMTADAMMGTKERCLKVGMDDYITKPINQDELREILSRWVNFPEEATGTAADPAAAVRDNIVDLSLLRGFADSDEELKNHIDTFLAEAKGVIEKLAANCTDGENDQWSNAAHKLKGGAGMLQAAKLKSLCEKAQDMKQSTAAARSKMFEDIKTELGQVRKALAAATAKKGG